MDAGLIGGLSGRNVLVTGGSRGIGRATVDLLARCGANVGIGYRRDGGAAEAAVSAALDRGVQAFSYPADLSASAEAEKLFEDVLDDLSPLHAVVVNAGIWRSAGRPLADLTDAEWEETIGSNLDSAFFTSRFAARHVADGGSIVLVSSTAGQRGEPYHADYAASKGAMISLTKSLAVELGARDINVNCVAPGWVETDMVTEALEQGGRDVIESEIPLGRVASPADIAGPIAFLCSPLARHITGEVLNVNGGSVRIG